MSDPYAPKENDLVAKYKPLMAKLTLSSMMGYCTAVAAKRIGTAVAFVAGVGFIALQGLVYAGVAELDWKEAEKGIVKAIDTDGDGKITEADLKVYWKKFIKFATYKLPDAAGFGFGFLFGLRH